VPVAAKAPRSQYDFIDGYAFDVMAPFIGASGEKRFFKGGRVAGLYFLIGIVGQVVCNAEGYATGARIHAATGYAVAVAFNAGNLGDLRLMWRYNEAACRRIVSRGAAAFP